MGNKIKEIKLENSNTPTSVKENEKILFQMKNCICKIETEAGKKGTGFFCKIKENQNLLPVLATNNQVLNSENLRINKSISFTFNEEKEKRKILIDENRKIYTNKEMDISFIEIKPNDKIENFLEIDEDIFKEEKTLEKTKYINHPTYLLHYPKNDVAEVSYGQILNNNEYNINHSCKAESGSAGAPILSLKSFKVIGINYIGISDKYNICKLIKSSVIAFYQKYYRKNKLTCIFEGRKYNFYDEYYNFVISNNDRNIFGHKFVENNKNNCKVIINSTEYPLQEHYDKNLFLTEKEWNEWDNNDNKKFEVTLIESNTVIDMSYMFFNCGFRNLNNQIDFSEWDISKVIKFK